MRGTIGWLPVAITSVSYSATVPSAPRTLLCREVDLVDPHPGVQRHTARGVPGQRVDEDVRGAVMPGEDARQQDAVVVPVRLVAEDGHVEPVRAAPGEQIVDEPGAGHAVADHDETVPRHAHDSPRTAQTLNSGIRLTGSSAAWVRRLIDCAPPQ